ncbi:MAG: ribbon-helix-helix domain-containing protein [Rhizobiaceae bacterium]
MSVVRKRSVTIGGHRTSYSIEDPFHEELVRIAAERGMPVAALIAEIDAARPPETNLSSAIRQHVLEWLKGRRTG